MLMIDFVSPAGEISWDHIFPYCAVEPSRLRGYAGEEVGISDRRWVFCSSSFVRLFNQIVAVMGVATIPIMLRYAYCGKALFAFSGVIPLSNFNLESAAALDDEFKKASRAQSSRPLKLGEWLVGAPLDCEMVYWAQYVLAPTKRSGAIFDFYAVSGKTTANEYLASPPLDRRPEFRVQVTPGHLFSASRIWKRIGQRTIILDPKPPVFISYADIDAKRSRLSGYYLNEFNDEDAEYLERYVPGRVGANSELEFMTIWMPSVLEARLKDGLDPFHPERVIREN